MRPYLMPIIELRPKHFAVQEAIRNVQRCVVFATTRQRNVDPKIWHLSILPIYIQGTEFCEKIQVYRDDIHELQGEYFTDAN